MSTDRNEFSNNIQNKYRYKKADTINVNLDNQAKGLFDGLGLSYQKIPTLNHDDTLPDQIEGKYTKDNLSLRKNPRVSDKKADAVAMHEIYHHIQKDKGMNLADEEQGADLIEQAYLNENQQVSQELDFDLIYAHTIRQFYEHDELEQLVRIFGGDEETAQKLYSKSMLVIKEGTQEEENKITVKNTIGKESSGLKEFSSENDFEIKKKVSNQITSVDNDELINFEEEHIEKEIPRYKIKGLRSRKNRKTETQTISFLFSAKCSRYGFLEPSPQEQITQAISSKLHTYSEELGSGKIALIIVKRIDEIHKTIRLVPKRRYEYKIKIVINGFHLGSISIQLRNLKAHTKKSLELKVKEEKALLRKKQKELEKQAEIDKKLEKIYDAKIEKVLNRKLDKEGKKFIKYIQNLSKRIERSHKNYRKAYSDIGVIGHISAALAGNFRRPKIDKFWKKALKLCKQVESKEHSEIEKWKKEIKDYYKGLKRDYKIPWHIKEQIGEGKGYKALDAWIEGRGTEEKISYAVRDYLWSLERRLFYSVYELKSGEDAWNKWVNESIKGAERVIFILTLAKDAGGVATTVIGGPAASTIYSIASETATQTGNAIFLDKKFDLLEVVKVGILTHLGGKAGRAFGEKLSGMLLKNSKLTSLISKYGVKQDIFKCMTEFLVDSAVKESINIVANKVSSAYSGSKSNTPENFALILSSDPTIQNLFANVLINGCGPNRLQKLKSQNKIIKLLE